MIEDQCPRDRLEHMGFRSVGIWQLAEGRPQCVLTDQAAATNILYAFIVDGVVVYIGKTVQTLKQRMSGYQRPGPTQSTNIKCNGFILEALLLSKAVIIYALPDNGLLYYGGFHVNLAAGLEDSLVRSLRPQWNKAGI